MPSFARGESLQRALVDVQHQRFISFDLLVDAVSRAHVVAVGEEHYHPGIQAFELKLLRALAQRHPQRLALAMEFLERDDQQTVDAYLAGKIDRAGFKKHLAASAPFMRHYFPLVRYARQQGLPVIAMNAPRHITRQVAREGLRKTLQRLSRTDRTYLAATLSAVTPRYRTYFLEAVAKFHTLKGDQVGRFVEASHLKDETMADSLARFLEQHADFTVLAIAGRFHFDYGTAIPSLLLQRRQRVAIQRLTTMVVERNGITESQRLAEEGIADYVWFTLPTAREPQQSDT